MLPCCCLMARQLRLDLSVAAIRQPPKLLARQVYDPMTGLESLLVAPISRASAAQRAGRAGRVRMGHAFRLCTEAAFRGDLIDATVRDFTSGALQTHTRHACAGMSY